MGELSSHVDYFRHFTLLCISPALLPLTGFSVLPELDCQYQSHLPPPYLHEEYTSICVGRPPLVTGSNYPAISWFW